MSTQIKELVEHLLTLQLPLENEYKIIQMDSNQIDLGGILLVSTNKGEEKHYRYCSGTFNENQKSFSSID